MWKLLIFAGLGLLVFIAAPGVRAQSLLPDGPNKDLVQLVCSECHTTDRIASKRMTKVEWTEEVAEMLQETPDVTEEEKEKIIEYLAKYFPAESEKVGVKKEAKLQTPEKTAASKSSRS